MRDLRRDAVWLTARDGRRDYVKLVDFGLAAVARDPRLLPAGTPVGAPAYLSPEQARGDEASPLSDLYSLGVLFFELLVGRLPFHGAGPAALLDQHRTRLPPSPRSIRPELDPRAESVVLRLLEKDPQARYADALSVRAALRSLEGPNAASLYRSAACPSPPGHEH